MTNRNLLIPYALFVSLSVLGLVIDRLFASVEPNGLLYPWRHGLAFKVGTFIGALVATLVIVRISRLPHRLKALPLVLLSLSAAVSWLLLSMLNLLVLGYAL